jgi:hypothetical protein
VWAYVVRPVYEIQSASAACVVYPKPGSSESGAVPTATVTVPPDLPVLVDVEVLAGVEADFAAPDFEELDELPHALKATIATTERIAESADRLLLLKTCLLLEVVVSRNVLGAVAKA